MPNTCFANLDKGHTCALPRPLPKMATKLLSIYLFKHNNNKFFTYILQIICAYDQMCIKLYK